jgi:hypothetical protein
MRFPRIEAILGCPIDEAAEHDLEEFIRGGVDETSDLDFKRERHQDNQALATDVAAFANAAGGLIVIGVDEDGDGRAANLTPQRLDETDELRIRQVVADSIRPYLSVRVRRLESQRVAGSSYLLISIPASRDAPHFVHKGQQSNLRCPCRDGKSTRYLAEAEIADRYRARFASAQDRMSRLAELTDLGVKRLSLDAPWLTLSVVPVAPGRFRLGGGGAGNLGRWIQDVGATLPPFGSHALWEAGVRGRVGPGRLSVRSGIQGSASAEPAKYALVDLYEDGSCFAATQTFARGDQTPQGTAYATMWDTSATRDMAAMLLVANRHAVDNAQVEGDAICRVRVVEDPALVRAGFTESRAANSLLPTITLLDEAVDIDTQIDLSATRTGWPDFLLTTRQLLDGVVQAFGLAEIGTIDQQGALSIQHLEPPFDASRIRNWAAEHGVAIV